MDPIMLSEQELNEVQDTHDANSSDLERADS